AEEDRQGREKRRELVATAQLPRQPSPQGIGDDDQESGNEDRDEKGKDHPQEEGEDDEERAGKGEVGPPLSPKRHGPKLITFRSARGHTLRFLRGLAETRREGFRRARRRPRPPSCGR